MFMQNKHMQWKCLTYVFNKIVNGNFYCCGFRPYFAEKLKLRFNTRKNSVAVVGDENQKREMEDT